MAKTTKEIRWHETRPIFSCDLQPLAIESSKGKQHPYAREQGSAEMKEPTQWRLATAGGDNHVRIWRITPLPESEGNGKDAGQPKVEFAATLSRHTGVVNVVRFSPSGHTLASAGDDGNVLLWSQSDEPMNTSKSLDDPTEEAQFATENWKCRRSLQVTRQEIYDLAWSPDGEWLIVGSTDNTARVYAAATSREVGSITDHNNYVQGVAWDPLNQYFATQSNDRHMHVYKLDVRKQANGESQFHFQLFGRKSSKIAVDDKRQQDNWEREPFKRPESRRSVSRASDSETSEAGSSRQARLAESTLADHDAMLPPRPSPTGRRSSVTSATSVTSPKQNAVSSASGGALPVRAARSPSPMPPLPANRLPGAASSPSNRERPLPSASTATALRQQTLFGASDVSPFFRRLAWSTDGSLLVAPAGVFDDPFAVPESTPAESSKKKARETANGGPRPTVYLYSRANLGQPPVAYLPGHKSGSIAIAFNPILFELRTAAVQAVTVNLEVGQTDSTPMASTSKDVDQKAEPLTSAFDLPYRMVYAVATHETIYIYDTQQAGPICMLGKMHYAPYTDCAWSLDGQTLVISSQDGYCSIVAFEENELGTPVDESQQLKRSTVALDFSVSGPQPAPVSAKRPAELDSTADGQQPPKKKRAVLTTVAPA